MEALSPILMMLLMFGVFYLILIRPQVKKQRETQEMLKKLDKGDTVITRGGLIGRISGSSGDIVVLELQEKVRVRIPRSYIEGKWEEDKDKEKAKSADKDSKDKDAKDKDKDAKDKDTKAA